MPNAATRFSSYRTCTDPGVCFSVFRHQLHGLGHSGSVGELHRAAIRLAAGSEGAHGVRSPPERSGAAPAHGITHGSDRRQTDRAPGTGIDAHSFAAGLAVG